MRAQTRNRWLGLVLAAAAAACGRASTTLPDTPPTSEPAPIPTGPAVVKITAAGVSPQIVHIYSGKTVMFLNNDDRPHSIFSDMHPAHGTCAGGLNIGMLQPGEQREATAEYGLCYFHDDQNPANPAFQGFTVLH
jgi:plastocyanin